MYKGEFGIFNVRTITGNVTKIVLKLNLISERLL